MYRTPPLGGEAVKVVFTDHALERCKRRNIDITYLRKQLEALPRMKNVNNWWFGNIRVSLAAYPDRLVVLTVLRRES
jgi:hypothetical protein